MSESVESMSNEGLDRRSMLKKAAITAGAAAFATPVVAGVFSSPAAADFANCDPTIDSDAIDVLSGAPREWNLNCDSQNTNAGRYNAQRSTFQIPGTNQTATIVFGLEGTDNYPVECSFYTIDVPTGWECTAKFDLRLANNSPGCVGNGQVQAQSTPGNCAPPHADFTPSVSAPLSLPYCRQVGGHPNECVSGLKLRLYEFVCCPDA